MYNSNYSYNKYNSHTVNIYNVFTYTYLKCNNTCI